MIAENRTITDPKADLPTGILVCPVCKGKLHFASRLVQCSECLREFPQAEGSPYDLLPQSYARDRTSPWRKRLLEMEQWYRDLISSPLLAENCFRQDYEPYASVLATFRGRVLDLGGGNGLVRHYLPSTVEYWAVDPSLTWHNAEWASIKAPFPCLAKPFAFVRAVGEYLPFPDRSFDGALSFWSLNHVDQPERVLQEAGRVLKPGGRLLMVLEEMPPTLSDWPKRIRFSLGSGYRAKMVNDLLIRIRTGEWPLQPDHIRIQESDLRRWTDRQFTSHRRSWVRRYLTYEWRRRQGFQDTGKSVTKCAT